MVAADKTAEIFAKRYWDRPLPRPKGAEDPKQIYQAVGEALSQWEYVDQKLSELFCIFACVPDADFYTKLAVTRAYGSIISTANRRSAIEAAAAVYFPDWMKNGDLVRKDLNKILKAAESAAKLRDDIAPHTHDPKLDHFSEVWRARYCYNDQDINDIKMKFWTLQQAIREFVGIITLYVSEVRSTFLLGSSRIGSTDAMNELSKRLAASKS